MGYKSTLTCFLDTSQLLTAAAPPTPNKFPSNYCLEHLRSLSLLSFFSYFLFPLAFKTCFNAAVWENFVTIATCLEEANCVGCSLQRHFRVIKLVISRLTLKMRGKTGFWKGNGALWELTEFCHGTEQGNAAHGAHPKKGF